MREREKTRGKGGLHPLPTKMIKLMTQGLTLEGSLHPTYSLEPNMVIFHLGPSPIRLNSPRRGVFVQVFFFLHPTAVSAWHTLPPLHATFARRPFALRFARFPSSPPTQF